MNSQPELVQLYSETPAAKKVWEEPRIILERSLEASARTVPGPDGKFGPLGTSGGSGLC
jgi:hypothetical protein